MTWIPKVGDKVRLIEGPMKGQVGIVIWVLTSDETQADAMAGVEFPSHVGTYPWDELEPVGEVND